MLTLRFETQPSIKSRLPVRDLHGVDNVMNFQGRERSTKRWERMPDVGKHKRQHSRLQERPQTKLQQSRKVSSGERGGNKKKKNRRDIIIFANSYTRSLLPLSLFLSYLKTSHCQYKLQLVYLQRASIHTNTPPKSFCPSQPLLGTSTFDTTMLQIKK